MPQNSQKGEACKRRNDVQPTAIDGVKMPDVDQFKGLKHRDLKPCIFCGKGMMHAGGIAFYRLTLERCVVNIAAVQRAAGLEQMLGGHALLANVMGPNEDLAKIIPDPAVCLVCDDCACGRSTIVAAISERISDREDAARAAAE
jgi:hypothetical protein